MTKVGFFALLTALASLGANADTVVTSKTYVDAKISSSADISSTSTTTAPNEAAVYTAINSATSAANNLLTQVISNADTSHAPSGDAVHDALADKQNKIDSTGTAPFDDAEGSVVTTTDSAGVVGEKFIWTADGGDGAAWDINEYYDSNAARTAVRDAIPTVIAVEAGLIEKQNRIDSYDSATTGPSVLIDSTERGVVGKRAILDMETYDNNFNLNDLMSSPLSNMIPDVGLVGSALVDASLAKQDKLGGNNMGGKVVTATANAGNVTYTTIKTSVDSSSDLITAGAVKDYADAKVSSSSSISSVSTTTAPNEKAVYDSISAVQSAVTALQNCKHTCANTACTLIDVDCVDSYTASGE